MSVFEMVMVFLTGSVLIVNFYLRTKDKKYAMLQAYSALFCISIVGQLVLNNQSVEGVRWTSVVFVIVSIVSILYKKWKA